MRTIRTSAILGARGVEAVLEQTTENIVERLIQICRDVGVHATPDAIVPLGSAGGFSGAKFWRCSDANGDWCIRRWPDGTRQDRVDWIHAVIYEIDRALAHESPNCRVGISESLPVGWLAIAQSDARGLSSFVREDGIYEVSRWLPGVANYWTDPNDKKLASAMRALARWHRAAATLSSPVYHHVALSPGMATRASRCRALLNGETERLEAAGLADARQHVRDAASRLVSGFRNVGPELNSRIQTMAGIKWRQQLCLRDIWHDHMLFDEAAGANEVSGIVDYDAVRVESPVGDVARLLGSLVGDDRERFRTGLEFYESICSLTKDEHRLLSIWDASNAAMAGLQWIQWLCLEGRHFDDEEAVAERLKRHVTRISSLC